MDELKPSGKPFDISKWEVWEAYRQVKANQGAPGVDGVTIEEFEKDLKNNLYKIWNRMSLGVLFPASGEGGGDTETAWRWDENPWRADDRGQDRPDGGGPQAGGEGRTDLPSGLLRLPAAAGRLWTRWRHAGERCWKSDWVIDLDIQKFFDSVPWITRSWSRRWRPTPMFRGWCCM